MNNNGQKVNRFEMRIEIIRSEDVSPALVADINRRADEIDWGNADGVAEWAGGDWQMVVWEGETWVSALVLIERTITVSGKPVAIGGIGGVMTLPEWRCRGYASAGMKAAADFIRDELKAPFGLLLCNAHRVGFYQSLGWRVASAPTTITQTTGKRLFSDVVIVMTYACSGHIWPSGGIDLCGPPW